jgi:hypothetical protein
MVHHYYSEFDYSMDDRSRIALYVQWEAAQQMVQPMAGLVVLLTWTYKFRYWYSILFGWTIIRIIVQFLLSSQEKEHS